MQPSVGLVDLRVYSWVATGHCVAAVDTTKYFGEMLQDSRYT